MSSLYLYLYTILLLSFSDVSHWLFSDEWETLLFPLAILFVFTFTLFPFVVLKFLILTQNQWDFSVRKEAKLRVPLELSFGHFRGKLQLVGSWLRVFILDFRHRRLTSLFSLLHTHGVNRTGGDGNRAHCWTNDHECNARWWKEIRGEEMECSDTLGLGYSGGQLCDLSQSHYGSVYRVSSQSSDTLLGRMHCCLGCLQSRKFLAKQVQQNQAAFHHKLFFSNIFRLFTFIVFRDGWKPDKYVHWITANGNINGTVVKRLSRWSDHIELLRSSDNQDSKSTISIYFSLCCSLEHSLQINPIKRSCLLL